LTVVNPFRWMVLQLGRESPSPQWAAAAAAIEVRRAATSTVYGADGSAGMISTT
jgi:hypothetical protein